MNKTERDAYFTAVTNLDDYAVRSLFSRVFGSMEHEADRMDFLARIIDDELAYQTDRSDRGWYSVSLEEV